MKSLRIVAAFVLAFGALFATPANAFTSQTFQFTFFWTAREFTFTDQTVTVTVINNITNKIGGNGEVIDTYRITLGDERIEVTEKHDARDYVFAIEGTQTMRLEGIDRGFWAGDWGPIMTVSASETQPVIEAPSESPVIPTESPVVPTESPVIEPTPEPQPEPVPAAPSQAETEERASDVLGDYSAFWTSNGLIEADYAHNLAIVRWYQIKASYDEAIAESKRGKSFIFAMQLEGQLRTIKSLYANGSLKPKVVEQPAPEVTSSPTVPPVPTEAPTVSPEPTPTPTPEPPKQEQEPIVEPKPEQPTVSPEEEPAPKPEAPKVPTQEPKENEPRPLPEPESPSVSEEPSPGPVDETDNGIIVEVSTSEELAILAEQDDPQLPEQLASLPLIGDVAGAVLELFNDLGNVGADMTPEVREKSEKVVVAAVIVGQIATAAVASVASRKVG